MNKPYLTTNEKNALEIVIALHNELGSWRKVEKLLKINRGYLSAIAAGHKRPSAKVIAAVGLHPDHVKITVTPCPTCGAIPNAAKHRCPKSAPKYAPHPVIRYTELERRMVRILGLLVGETPSSIHQIQEQS